MRPSFRLDASPGVGVGALVGGLLTASLMALWYLAFQLAMLPFVPFDLFDRMARLLPGDVVAFGVESMVSVIRALALGETSGTAKAGEQLMALGGCLAAGIVLGAAFFALWRARAPRSPERVGAVLGAGLGLLALAAGRGVSQELAASPLVGAAWVLGSLAAWGALAGWAFRRLAQPAAQGAEVAEAGTEAADLVRLDRRRFLIRFGGASAVVVVGGAVLGAQIKRRRELDMTAALSGAEPWSAANPLPNAGDAVMPAPGTRAELTPVGQHYRIDINTRPVVVDPNTWRLKIGGLVDRPLELTLDELRTRYEPQHHFVTLECISNPVAGDLIGTTRWTGANLGTVLADAGLQPSATHLKVTAADGFYEYVPLADVLDDKRMMLAYAWDGLPLASGHGFPLRIYWPDHFGMKQPKWITSIEAVPAWEQGYWVARGWDKEARMLATSVIDTVGVDMMIIEADQATRVPLGGIAFAGARGISKVEVRIDDGAWQSAELRRPLSDTSWVLWRYDWPFAAGKHTFTVRCLEGDGTPQIAAEAPPRPSGATGLHAKGTMM